MAEARKFNHRASALDDYTVQETLARIARDVEPICKRFKLRYGQLGASIDKSLYGLIASPER